MENAKLQSEMNKISLRCCENIKTGDMCHYFFPESAGIRQAVKSIMRVVYYSLFNTCKYTVLGNPTTLSLLSSSFCSRSDHCKAFENVTELIDNQIIITPSGRKFDPSSLHRIFLPLVWTFQLRKTSATLIERMILSADIYKAYTNLTYVQRQISKKKFSVKYLMTYCDVMPIDSFFAQSFRAKGFTIVTLQHGYCNIKTNAWAYKASISDYFLADSPASADLGYSVGYSGNIIPVGSPHHLKMENKKAPESFPCIESIGVIMNSDVVGREDNQRADNIAMLKTVQEYCSNRHKKMLVKYHPTNHSDDYASYIDENIAKTYGQDITIDEFGDMVDVVIVSASTVFNTMLMRWKPVLLFVRDGHDPDMFFGTEKIKFSNEKQFADKIDFINTHEYKALFEKYRSYFLCSGVYRENYKKALQKIGIM